MNRFFLFISLLIFLIGSNALAAEVSFQIENIKNQKGKVYLVLFAEDNGEFFPKKLEKSACQQNSTIPGPTVTLRCTDLPHGRFAAFAYHDENSNGKLDRYWIGIPSEDYGLSTNPDIIGPPDFEDAVFEIKSEKTELIIQLD